MMETLIRLFGGKFDGRQKLATLPYVAQKIVVCKQTESKGEKFMDVAFYKLSDVRIGITKELIYSEDKSPEIERIGEMQRIELC